jgi:hypothetical protein
MEVVVGGVTIKDATAAAVNDAIPECRGDGVERTGSGNGTRN